MLVLVDPSTNFHPNTKYTMRGKALDNKINNKCPRALLPYILANELLVPQQFHAVHFKRAFYVLVKFLRTSSSAQNQMFRCEPGNIGLQELRSFGNVKIFKVLSRNSRT